MPPRPPVYAQIVEDITAAIRDGRLKPGDRLPTLNELCAQYQASRQPVRTALLILAERGLVETYQGRGTYVSPP